MIIFMSEICSKISIFSSFNFGAEYINIHFPCKIFNFYQTCSLDQLVKCSPEISPFTVILLNFDKNFLRKVFRWICSFDSFFYPYALDSILDELDQNLFLQRRKIASHLYLWNDLLFSDWFSKWCLLDGAINQSNTAPCLIANQRAIKRLLVEIQRLNWIIKMKTFLSVILKTLESIYFLPGAFSRLWPHHLPSGIGTPMFLNVVK